MWDFPAVYPQNLRRARDAQHSKRPTQSLVFLHHTFMTTYICTIKKCSCSNSGTRGIQKPWNFVAVPAYCTKDTNITNNIRFFLLFFNPDLSISTSIRLYLERNSAIKISAKGFTCKSILKYIPNAGAALRQTQLSTQKCQVSPGNNLFLCITRNIQYVYIYIYKYIHA